MSTLLLSFWRDDVASDLAGRISHLLNKAEVDQWMWVVGDSSDATEAVLRSLESPNVHVVRADTGIVGEDIETRRRRISVTETLAYAALAGLESKPDYVVQHESDLRSPYDVIPRLLKHADTRTVVAGWPTLEFAHTTLFYDIWAYRGLNGLNFTNHPPFHASYLSSQPFEVASVGSVWMAPYSAWVNRKIKQGCCVELCNQWVGDGFRILVDPTIPIEQPRELWRAQ